MTVILIEITQQKRAEKRTQLINKVFRFYEPGYFLVDGQSVNKGRQKREKYT